MSSSRVREVGSPDLYGRSSSHQELDRIYSAKNTPRSYHRKTRNGHMDLVDQRHNNRVDYAAGDTPVTVGEGRLTTLNIHEHAWNRVRDCNGIC